MTHYSQILDLVARLLPTMPVACVKWLGETPDVAVSDRLLILVESFTYEEIDAFTVIGYHNPNMADCSKVIIFKDNVFLAVQHQDIFVLIPDIALNIRNLISMIDADKWTLNTLTIESIQNVMNGNILCNNISS